MILLLGGTSDARELAAELRGAGYDVLVSTASDYGARLAAPTGTAVRGGRLDEEELTCLIEEADAVVDATHPFAEVISAAAVKACAAAGRPYLRVPRAALALPAGVVRAADAAEAARLAVELVRARAEAGPAGERHPGAILLTVGSKTLATYARVAREAGVRLVARVLPTPQALEACSEAGLEPADVVAMQGPTSAGLDAALLRHLGATVLVTKESGDAGGVAQKLRAAGLAGATAVVVERPAAPAVEPAVGSAPTGSPAAARPDTPEVASTPAEVLGWLRGLAGIAADPTFESGGRRRVPRGLFQVYTGDGKGKTTAAAGQALRARGAGLSVIFIQFVKGGPESSELAPLRAAGVDVVRPAVARSGLLRGAATLEDRAAAAAAWAAARAALTDPACDLVVLDELHAALRHRLVALGEVIAALAARPPHQEVVTTGRGAPEELLAAAGLVTEMTAVRHPYPDVPARKGIEL